MSRLPAALAAAAFSLVAAVAAPAFADERTATAIRGAEASTSDPVVGVDGTGGAVAAWTEGDDELAIRLATRRTLEGGWSAPSGIPGLTTADVLDGPLVAVTPAGGATIAWVRGVGDDREQVMAARWAPGDAFLGVAPVGDAAPQVTLGDLAAAGDGTSVIVWSEGDAREWARQTIRASLGSDATGFGAPQRLGRLGTSQPLEARASGSQAGDIGVAWAGQAVEDDPAAGMALIVSARSAGAPLTLSRFVMDLEPQPSVLVPSGYGSIDLAVGTAGALALSGVTAPTGSGVGGFLFPGTRCSGSGPVVPIRASRERYGPVAAGAGGITAHASKWWDGFATLNADDPKAVACWSGRIPDGSWMFGPLAATGEGGAVLAWRDRPGAWSATTLRRQLVQGFQQLSDTVPLPAVDGLLVDGDADAAGHLTLVWRGAGGAIRSTMVDRAVPTASQLPEQMVAYSDRTETFSLDVADAGGPTTVTWHFGDGVTLTGPTVSRTFSVGPRNVQVIVTDQVGNSVERRTRLTVKPGPPRVPISELPRPTLEIVKGTTRFRAAARGASLSSRRTQKGRGGRIVLESDLGGVGRFALRRLDRGRRSGSRCVVGRRTGARCTRKVTIRSAVKRDVPAGRSAVYLSGRWRAAKLKPGLYELTITVTAEGKRSEPGVIRFRVRK